MMEHGAWDLYNTCIYVYMYTCMGFTWFNESSFNTNATTCSIFARALHTIRSFMTCSSVCSVCVCVCKGRLLLILQYTTIIQGVRSSTPFTHQSVHSSISHQLISALLCFFFFLVVMSFVSPCPLIGKPSKERKNNKFKQVTVLATPCMHSFKSFYYFPHSPAIQVQPVNERRERRSLNEFTRPSAFPA